MYMSELRSKVISNDDYPVVDTKYGKVRGLVKDDVFIFRGVKYGKAARFQFCEEPDSWEEIADATSFSYGGFKSMAVASDELTIPHYYLPWNEEDCHNLNIWTPSIDKNAKKPVVIWLQAGVCNHTMEQYATDGEELARNGDVVFVGYNLRGRVTGMLDLSLYGQKYARSNMCVLSDMVRAVTWIHENIQNFGGDPQNVTLMSQSGGAIHAFLLMHTPAVAGMFHKVTLEGWMLHPMKPPEGMTIKQIHQIVGKYTVEALGLDESTIDAIDTVDINDLSAAADYAAERLWKEYHIKYHYSVVADNEYTYQMSLNKPFPGIGPEVSFLIGGDIADSRSNDRVKIGDNKPHTWDQETVMDYMRQMYGDRAEAVADAFRKTYPDTPLCEALYLDRKGRRQVLRVANNQAGIGAKVWMWMFKYVHHINGNTIAYHCSVNPFVLHNTEYLEASFNPEKTAKIQEDMTYAWLSFIKNGRPAVPEGTDWPAVVPGDEGPTMVFGEGAPYVTSDLDLQEIVKPWYIGDSFMGNSLILRQISYDMKDVMNDPV